MPQYDDSLINYLECENKRKCFQLPPASPRSAKSIISAIKGQKYRTSYDVSPLRKESLPAYHRETPPNSTRLSSKSFDYHRRVTPTTAARPNTLDPRATKYQYSCISKSASSAGDLKGTSRYEITTEKTKYEYLPKPKNVKIVGDIKNSQVINAELVL